MATDMRRKGLRHAARACLSLAAFVLALSALALLTLPASDALAGHRTIDPPAMTLSLDAGPAEFGSPHGDMAHQCPQCAGHQVVMADDRPATIAVRVSQVRFPVIARAAPEFATAPPHEPPRA